MRSIVIGFGLLVLCLLLFFRIAELQVWQGNVRLEMVVAAASVLFFFIGIYFNRKSIAAADAPGEAAATGAPVPPVAISDAGAVRAAGLSARELEVLQKMAEGLSNAEIAKALYLSESTIKTHVSNILQKLDVKRRTAAVQAARARKILS